MPGKARRREEIWPWKARQEERSALGTTVILIIFKSKKTLSRVTKDTLERGLSFDFPVGQKDFSRKGLCVHCLSQDLRELQNVNHSLLLCQGKVESSHRRGSGIGGAWEKKSPRECCDPR